PRPKRDAAPWAHEARRLRSAVPGVESINLEPERVGAKSDGRPQSRQPFGFVLRVDAATRLQHGVLAPRLEAHSRSRVIQTDGGGVVVPHLNADRVLDRMTVPVREPLVTDL